MCNIVINGGRELSGSVKIHGAKNSVLPILAATILSHEESIIKNCPDLSDVRYSLEILEHLGCTVKREGDTVIINPAGVNCGCIPDILMHQMRSSITFLGAILGRCKEAKMCAPGGCELGARPIDLHIKALREMGAEVNIDGNTIEATGGNMKGAKINLKFPSVGATENIMLAAVLCEGITVISNAAREPEIWDLQEFLCGMGAKISGAGSDVVVIEGVQSLRGANHSIIPDRIVAATYLSAGMMCGGKIALENANAGHMGAIIDVFCKMGADIKVSGSEIILKAPEKIKSVERIETVPYPGFPTDAQAPVMAALTLAEGESLIDEKIFDNRFRHCAELCKMGADITCNKTVAIIKGVPKLFGAKVEAMELRGGAALTIAGAAAEGITTVSKIEYIERGYENIVRDLSCLGVEIKKTN